MKNRPGSEGPPAVEKASGLSEAAKAELKKIYELLNWLNKARQNHREAMNVYRYVVGIHRDAENIGADKPIGAPEGLTFREDLKPRFDFGLEGKQYRDEATAAHDLIEELAREALAKERVILSEGMAPDLNNREEDLAPAPMPVEAPGQSGQPGAILDQWGNTVDRGGNVVRTAAQNAEAAKPAPADDKQQEGSPYKPGEIVNPYGEVVNKDGEVVRRVKETGPVVDERSKEIGADHPLREPKTESELEAQKMAAMRKEASALRILDSVKLIEVSWSGPEMETARQAELKRLEGLIEWLNTARQGHREAGDVYRYVIGLDAQKPADAPEGLTVRPDLNALFDFGLEGKQYNDEAEAAHDLIEHLAEEATKKKEALEKMSAGRTDGAERRAPVEGSGLETAPLEDLRRAYLKLRYLTGLIIKRGKVEVAGIEFRARDPLALGILREAYNNRLALARETELLDFVKKNGLDTVKELSPEQRALIARHLIEQQKSEQVKVDEIAEEMGHKNRFQIIRRWWKNFGTLGKSTLARLGSGVTFRMGLGTGLLAVGATGGVIGALGVGTRTAMTMGGTYVGAEALLERRTRLSQKGYFNEVAKEASKLKTTEAKRQYIMGLDRNAVIREVARLRALQIDKMISLENAGILRGGILRKEVYRQDHETLQMLIARNYEIVAEDAVKEIPEASKQEQLGRAMIAYMKLENSSRLEHSETQTQIERRKKIRRKLIATLLAVSVGALINWDTVEKIIGPGDVDPGTPPAPQPPDLTVEIMGTGENLWRIIEAKLSDLGILGQFLTEGQQTHLIDAFKNVFADMTPDQLQKIGFSSGDIDVLVKGDVLDISKAFGDNDFVMKAIGDTIGLTPTPELIAAIEANNSTINAWHAAHAGVFMDTETIQKILETGGAYEP